MNFSRTLRRPSGQSGSSPRGVGNETDFQKKTPVTTCADPEIRGRTKSPIPVPPIPDHLARNRGLPPGIGGGIPDSRFGGNRETANPRFPIMIRPGPGIGIPMAAGRGFPGLVTSASDQIRLVSTEATEAASHRLAVVPHKVAYPGLRVRAEFPLVIVTLAPCRYSDFFLTGVPARATSRLLRTVY